MTDLTEQWKKGELPSGWYYVKGNRAEGIYAYTAEYLNHMYSPKNSDRIIEPVPSYEEWKRILHYAGKYEVEYTSCVMDYENLKEENTKLKELLKECREPLEVLAEKRNACDWYPEDLLAKINQALGEDK